MLGGRQPVRPAEQSAEVRGVGQAPSRRNRTDRVVAERRVGQVGTAALETSVADPGRDRRVLGFEQAVQVTDGQMVRSGHRALESERPGPGEEPDPDLMKRWLAESYRAVAPKRLGALLSGDE